MLEKYTGKVKLAHKNFPHHDFSREAATTALAAEEQGKFWEIHAKFFENQSVLNAQKVSVIARELKLDMKKLERKIQDPAIEELIDRDMDDGRQLGILGTPTVYINGKLLMDHSLQGFETAIATVLLK
ncbi:MAG: thioredoxin domain-containing protein [Geobacter sp.]|nr:thioredoxin domain-containing protein [Geobacter sp.]